MARAVSWLLALAGSARSLVLAAKESADVGADPAISASSSKQIVAVLNTLNDIVSSVQGEQVKEARMFEDFQKWCKSEKKSLSSALDEAQSQSESSDVGSKELDATVVQLETRLAEIEKAIGETQDIMAKANTIRGKESDQSNDDMTLNRQSLDQVQKAIQIVEKVHRPGLLQDSALRRYQISEPGESSYVLGIMKGLKEKLEKTRKQLESEEKSKVDMHNKFMSTKKGEMSNLKSEKIQKKNTLTETRINLVELKHILEQSKKKVLLVTKLVKETSDLCYAKEQSYKVRSAERVEELAALKEAVAAIKTGAQLAAKPTKTKLLQEDAEPVSFVQLEVSRHHRTLQHKKAAGDVGKGKSQAVVQKLVALLEKQQAEEADKKNYCKAELEKKNKERTDVEDKLKQLKASIEFKGGEVETLQNEVKSMEKNIETMKKNLDEAAKLRKQEKASYEATAKDRKLAIKVLKQAQQVLKAFYAKQDKTALVQKPKKKTVVTPVKSTKPPGTWSDKSTRKTIRSATAVELMDKVAGEIEQEEKKAAVDETKAAAAYEKLQADSRAEFDRVMEEITQRVKRKAKLVVQLNSHKEEQTQRKADLEAVLSQLKTVHKECDELIANFEKRTKARNWEKSQLKDVIDILAGSSVAVRTGLVQAAARSGADAGEAAGLDDTASALLRDMASA